MKRRLVACVAAALMIALGGLTRDASSQYAGHSYPGEDPTWLTSFGDQTAYMVGEVPKCGSACDRATQSCCGAGGMYEM
jgi:hypothetical protein